MKYLQYILIFCFCFSMQAQNLIKSEKGYTNDIGNVVSMLNDLKRRVTSSVQGMSQYETDYLLDENANRIGAMILHLAATEAYYQVYTFENRGFNKQEKKKWDIALNLGDNARKELQGKPIDYYLDIYTQVRAKTLELLKSKDDEWLKQKNSAATMNNHWAWYHVMEHQANHMGQIRLIAKRIPEK